MINIFQLRGAPSLLTLAKYAHTYDPSSFVLFLTRQAPGVQPVYSRSADEVPHERAALLPPQQRPFRLPPALDGTFLVISGLEPSVRGGGRAPLLSHGRRLPLALGASTARRRARRRPWTGHVRWVAVVGEATPAAVVAAGRGSAGPCPRVVVAVVPDYSSAVVAEALQERGFC